MANKTDAQLQAEYWDALNHAKRELEEAMATLDHLRLAVNNRRWETAGAIEAAFLNQLQFVIARINKAGKQEVA